MSLEECDDGLCVSCLGYEARIEEVCKDAVSFLERRAKNVAGKPSIVVFDIDGTALDDRRKGRTLFPGGKTRLKRHEPVYKLYQMAVQLGYHVVFLTARIITIHTDTTENLKDQGYLTYIDLVMRPLSSRTINTERWKDEKRCDLTKLYDIVACIGDQAMDVIGYYVGERQFLLPTPPVHQLCYTL